jgi:hypothetical protein
VALEALVDLHVDFAVGERTCSASGRASSGAVDDVRRSLRRRQREYERVWATTAAHAAAGARTSTEVAVVSSPCWRC